MVLDRWILGEEKIAWGVVFLDGPTTHPTQRRAGADKLSAASLSRLRKRTAYQQPRCQGWNSHPLSRSSNEDTAGRSAHAGSNPNHGEA